MDIFLFRMARNSTTASAGWIFLPPVFEGGYFPPAGGVYDPYRVGVREKSLLTKSCFEHMIGASERE